MVGCQSEGRGFLRVQRHQHFLLRGTVDFDQFRAGDVAQLLAERFGISPHDRGRGTVAGRRKSNDCPESSGAFAVELRCLYPLGKGGHGIIERIAHL